MAAIDCPGRLSNAATTSDRMADLVEPERAQPLSLYRVVGLSGSSAIGAISSKVRIFSKLTVVGTLAKSEEYLCRVLVIK